MEQKNKSRDFRYTYSAKDQAEIRRIREKYAHASDTEDKMERLRRLDRRVTAKAQSISLVFGIIGMLLLGTGMSLCMSDFAEILGSHRNAAIAIGVVLGVVGGALAALAYPIYNRVTLKEKEKVTPEILRLTEELMK